MSAPTKAPTPVRPVAPPRPAGSARTNRGVVMFGVSAIAFMLVSAYVYASGDFSVPLWAGYVLVALVVLSLPVGVADILILRRRNITDTNYFG